MTMQASNRQKKFLTFCGVKFGERITVGAAGWEIACLPEECWSNWRKYVYLTNDIDDETATLKPFNQSELEKVIVPEDWQMGEAIKTFREGLAAEILQDQSPFDCPPPPITFKGKHFLFTGKFSFGTRNQCQRAVVESGGMIYKSSYVGRDLDFLVVGTEGSTHWKREKYGLKIEAAVLLRREQGAPAIVSEAHWVQFLPKK